MVEQKVQKQVNNEVKPVNLNGNKDNLILITQDNTINWVILSCVCLSSDFHGALSKLLANGLILDQQKQELELGPGICSVGKTTEDEGNWLLSLNHSPFIE